MASPIQLPFANLFAGKELRFIVLAEGTGQSFAAEDDLGKAEAFDREDMESLLASAADKSITLDELTDAGVAIAVRAAKIYGAALDLCSETYRARYERHIVALMRYQGGRLPDDVLAAMLDLPQIAHLQGSLHTEDFARIGELLGLHFKLRGIMPGQQDPVSMLNEVVDICVHFTLLFGVFGDNPLFRGKGRASFAGVEATIKRLTKLMDQLSIDTDD